MKYKFTADINHADIHAPHSSQECSELIVAQVKAELGIDLGIGNHGHIWMSHEQGAHRIQIYCYDNEGKGEHETMRWELKKQNTTYEREVEVKGRDGKVQHTLGGFLKDEVVDDPLAHKSPSYPTKAQLQSCIDKAIVEGKRTGLLATGRAPPRNLAGEV